MQIYWKKRNCVHKKRVQLPQDCFGAAQCDCRDVTSKHSKARLIQWEPVEAAGRMRLFLKLIYQIVISVGQEQKAEQKQNCIKIILVSNDPGLLQWQQKQAILELPLASGSKPSSETQGLLAGTMRYFRASDIFRQKFTLSAEEPLGTYSHRTSSRSGRIPLRWLGRKIFFCPISEEL